MADSRLLMNFWAGGRSSGVGPDAWRLPWAAVAGLVVVAGLATACRGEPPRPGEGATAAAGSGASSPTAHSTALGPAPASATSPGHVRRSPTSPASTQLLRIQVLGVRPHDPQAFTQGLVWHQGLLYESTGLTGRSSLREVDPATGQVLRKLDLAPQLFGEGLALVGDQLVQLTWQSGRAYVYQRSTFTPVSEFRYSGQGWGLCFDGTKLVMSDGSPVLSFRDAASFEIIGQVAVTLEGAPLERINELECVGEDVWANVWQTDTIVRIDPTSGAVEAVVDASGLLTARERRAADVLNGIAYNPQRQTFLITGKLWPKLFEVRFVPTAER